MTIAREAWLTADNQLQDAVAVEKQKLQKVTEANAELNAATEDKKVKATKAITAYTDYITEITSG